MRQIQLTANLSITAENYNISVNSSEDVVRVAVYGPAVPTASWSNLKQLFRYRKCTRFITQQIEIIYNNDLLITQKGRRTTYLRWRLIGRMLLKSIL